MTYTHHFILESTYQNGLRTKDIIEEAHYNYVRTADVEDMEKHWTDQNGTPMFVTNVYVTEEL